MKMRVILMTLISRPFYCNKNQNKRVLGAVITHGIGNKECHHRFLHRVIRVCKFFLTRMATLLLIPMGVFKTHSIGIKRLLGSQQMVINWHNGINRLETMPIPFRQNILFSCRERNDLRMNSIVSQIQNQEIGM